MKRKYNIEWYHKKDVKYGGDPSLIHTWIEIPHPTGEVSIDAKTAVDMFTRSVGNLHKIEITKIKELDENMKQIGEDIIPTEGETMVPIGGKH